MRLRMVFQHKASVEQQSMGTPLRSILVVSLALLPSIYIEETRPREAAKGTCFQNPSLFLEGLESVLFIVYLLSFCFVVICCLLCLFYCCRGCWSESMQREFVQTFMDAEGFDGMCKENCCRLFIYTQMCVRDNAWMTSAYVYWTFNALTMSSLRRVLAFVLHLVTAWRMCFWGVGARWMSAGLFVVQIVYKFLTPVAWQICARIRVVQVASVREVLPQDEQCLKFL